MSTNIQILALAGSTRRESYNKKLIRVAASLLRETGVEVTEIDLRDYPMPLYDGDLEQQEGITPNGKKLKELFKSHQGLLISSPEYNSSISGVLKNALDWVSRPEKGEPSLVAFSGKISTLLSASPGALGGLRGLVHLRQILGNIGVIVLPEQYALGKANEMFGPNGELTDVSQKEKLSNVVKRLGEILNRLSQK